MKTNEIFKLIDNEFLEKIYNFSYRRCNTSFEAEELCSQIIISVISGIKRAENIENFYAFTWTIARRVYADYCETRNKDKLNLSFEDYGDTLSFTENEIDELIEDISQKEQIKKIIVKITFLSKVYRDVMVMYYIDEIKIKDIASRLKISETAVKQRLFSARNEIRKEVSVVKENNLTLKPIYFATSGTGNPVGNDPKVKAERIFSQNLIYLCRDTPKTAKELSDELCVPMPYIEEELDIQVHGENGSYGMLRKLPNGKYATNVLLVDYSEYDEANKIFERHLPEIIVALKESISKYKDEILSFPYLSRQEDVGFILWSLISRTFWSFADDIKERIKKKHFADITSPTRPFSVTTVAFRAEDNPRFGFYGCDGIEAISVGGYARVHINNIYGKRIKEHFHCGHNLSTDEKIVMLIKSIGGIKTENLNDNEKEVLAKAIECGYIRKTGDCFEPNVIVIEEKDEEAFVSFGKHLQADMNDIKESIADELADFMKKHIPYHLINEYELYINLIAGIRIIESAIEECINSNILIPPKDGIGGEGTIVVVSK